jgi:hypothetical protein
MCLAKGHITAATVADHITPHRDDPHSFWYGELQSLCALHHNSDAQRAEKGGRTTVREVGVDGWAIETEDANLEKKRASKRL